MKRVTAGTLAVVSITIFAMPAVSQPPGEQRERGDFRGPPNAILAVIDADGDHEISMTEMEHAFDALKKLDRNKDGKLVRDEIHPSQNAEEPGRGGPGGRERGGPDERGNQGERGAPGGRKRGGPGAGEGGPPSPEQFVEHAMTFDADKDGMLNRVELSKMAEEFSRRGPGGRGGRPDGDAPRSSRPARPE